LYPPARSTTASRPSRRVAETLGECYERTGEFRAARESYKRARGLVGDDPLRRAELFRREGWLRQSEGAYQQAYSWYTRGGRLLDDVAAAPEAERLRAMLRLGAGLARLRQTRYADAVPLLEQAADQARRLGDRRTMAHAYHLLDWALTDLGRPEQRYRDEALPVFRELGDAVGAASCLQNLGISAFYEGRWDEALSFYECAVAECAKSGDVLEASQGRMNMSEVLVRQGHLARGEQLAREALEVSSWLRHPLGVGVALGSIGVALTRRGEFESAREALAGARASLSSIGAKRAVFEVDAQEAERLLLAGEHEAAAELARASLRRPEVAAAPGLVTQMSRVLGLSLALDGLFEAAEATLACALACAREANARYEEALALSALGWLAVLRSEDAGHWDQQAAPLLDQLGVIGELPLGPRRTEL
jgi:tetratricopeptide (TPR) repeat protein